MQSNLTYEIDSKIQRDNYHNHSQATKYVKSWNSPKSKLKNNISKIDDELISLKEKIKNVENAPKRSQSRFSFQYISSQQQADPSQELKFCSLLKEINEKESIIVNMFNDLKLIEAKMNSLHYENTELTGQLQSEVRLREAMEAEIQNLRQTIPGITAVEYENSRLREDNIRMFKIIEEKEQRENYNIELIQKQEKEKALPYYYPNEDNNYKGTHTQPNTSHFDFSPKGNESCYYNQSQDTDLNSHANYQSNLCDRDPIQNVNRNSNQYGRNNRNELCKACHNSLHHEKSKSVDLYTVNQNQIIFEEEENSNNQRNISNHYIEIDAIHQDQLGGRSKINNIKDQINQMQNHQLTPIAKQYYTIQNQTTSDFSIDDIDTNKDTRVRGRNQNSKSTLGIKESHSLLDNQTEDKEIPPHLETNLETISSDKANKISPINHNNSKVVSLRDKINHLTESLNQSKSDLDAKIKYIETIEEENQLLKKQLSYEKGKESLYKITESQASSLLQQENLQLSFHPTVSFFSQPIMEREKIQMDRKASSNKKGNLFSKLKLNTDIVIESTFAKHKVKLSDNLLFKPYDKKRLLCFDITNYGITLIEFIDYSDYDTSFITNSPTYLNHEDGIYIITGDNNDILYSYTHSTNALNKLSNLSNNHSHGGLVQYLKTSSNEKCLVCLSGWYNKKVEEYSTKRNEWAMVSEMPIERGESSFLVSNNEKIFSFFGYNCPQKKYLNTIDYCYVNSGEENDFKWKSLQYSYLHDAFSLYLKSHSLVSVSPNQFVIVGGYDGKENCPVEFFINMSIDDESNNVVFSKVKRKLFGIDKHRLYNFNCDFSPLLNGKGIQYQVCFDEEVRSHVINTSKMTHDIFYFD